MDEEPQENEDFLHPLLIPSVVIVLVENLNYCDLAACRLVCKTWDRCVRKKTSALLNPKILSLVLNHLDERFMLPCRAVCSLWNHVIINSPRWKNLELLEHSCGQWTAFFPNYHVGSSDFRRFSEKFGDPASLPLPLAFTHFTAPNNISLNDVATQDFLDAYGRYITSLELYRCKWSLEDLRHVLFECTVNLEKLRIVCGILPGTQMGKGKKAVAPELECVLHEDPSDFKILSNLKRLQVDFNVLDGRDRPRAYVEQFLIELFESAPNLQVINFDFKSWYARSWATNFIASCENIGLQKLRVLEHLVDPDLNGILNLTKKNFPLSCMKIRIRYRDVTIEALHGLLRSLKGTLTDLQLVLVDQACAHEFPSSLELEKLKSLELWKFKGQLGFLRDFRSLKNLLLGEMELKQQEIFCHTGVFRELLPGVHVTFKDYWESRVFS